MGKDPAVLFYVDNWITSTAEMDADCRGWYLTLLLYNYDKGSLPNDVEKLAGLCNVTFSNFQRFKQVFEQVLKHKFEQNEEGRLINPKAQEILQKRQTFKKKKSKSGKVGYIVKLAKSEFAIDDEQSKVLSSHLNELSEGEIEEYKNKHLLKHLLKDVLKLYINGDGDGDINIDGDIGESAKEFSDRVIATPVEDKTIMAAAWAYRQIADRFGEFYMPAIDFIKPIKGIDEKDKREIFNVLKFGLNHKFWSDKLVDSQSLQNHYRKVKAAYVNSKKNNQ